MYNQIENPRGKKLYMLTIVCTNNIQPIIIVDTWKYTSYSRNSREEWMEER